MLVSFVSAVLAGLVLNAKAATFEIETCQDFVDAAEATACEDTIAIVSEIASIDCGEEYVTMQVKNNELVVSGTNNGSLTDKIDIQNLRIEVSDSGVLTWGPKTDFVGDEDVILVSWKNEIPGYINVLYNVIFMLLLPGRV